MAACGRVTVIPFAPSMGIAYRWGEAIWSAFKLYGCDAAAYSETPPPNPARAAQAGTQFAVPAGLPTLSVAVRGAGGAPKVNLIAPDGSVAAASSPSQGVVATATSTLIEVGPQSATYIGVKEPPAGQWRIVPQAGSSPIAEAKFARGLPQPRVSARVRGSGRKRVLAYDVRPIPGQAVVFVERSGSVARILGTARRRSGEIAFAPADGRAGKRRIEALIEQDGVPRTQRKVAAYRAPGPARPAKPRLRVRRRGSRAVVRWRRVRLASRYEVRISVDDGRRELRFLRGRKRKISVPRIHRRTRATIAVTGVRPDLSRGPTARARIRR
jgi:hypothetical protein